MNKRPVAALTQDLLKRAADTRVALEAARRRGRMYLADPASDTTSAGRVLAEVVSLLETAPEPVHAASVTGVPTCEACGATEGVQIDLNLRLALCPSCVSDLGGAP